jgi:hypothetical protein
VSGGGEQHPACSGQWRTLDDIQEMRSQPETPKETAKLMDLCEEGRPGTFRVVATA